MVAKAVLETIWHEHRGLNIDNVALVSTLVAVCQLVVYILNLVQ